MTGFKPRTSGIGSDRSTTTAPIYFLPKVDTPKRFCSLAIDPPKLAKNDCEQRSLLFGGVRSV